MIWSTPLSDRKASWSRTGGRPISLPGLGATALDVSTGTGRPKCFSTTASSCTRRSATPTREACSGPQINDGKKVVIKQARAHVGGDERGLDARHLLANEAHVLGQLGPTGITPRLVAFFEQGGDSFLAEEALRGETLRTWNAARWADEVPRLASASQWPQKWPMRWQSSTSQGPIVRDFTPNNLIIQADGQIRLIDLELAVAPGTLDGYRSDRDPGNRSLTPAYGGPNRRPASNRP